MEVGFLTPASRASLSSPARGGRILLIDGRAGRGGDLARALVADRHSLTVVESIAAALESVDSEQPNMVLVDPDWLGSDGATVSALLGAWVRCPIVVISSIQTEESVIAALDSGADDYVVKPYSMNALLARIRVAVRRSWNMAVTVADEVLSCGDVTLDLGAHTLFLGEDVAALPPQQFALLTVFLRNVDKVVPAVELERVLWGEQPTSASAPRLRAAVGSVRRRLGTGPRRPSIETYMKLGYRLVSPSPEPARPGSSTRQHAASSSVHGQRTNVKPLPHSVPINGQSST